MRLDLGIADSLSPAMARAQSELAKVRAQAAALARNKDDDPKAVRAMAQEFEALLIEQMIHAMRQGEPEAQLLEPSRGEQVFREMLDGEYARLLAQRGGIGLADLLVQQIEAQRKAAPVAAPKPPGG
ncbi:MAG: rod-binding protein [Candidatus Lambdaproteobacteria bacterium]|nr:rod-binding protein [Candidatus Lambdaproteobacteria bacterium]